MRIVFMGTPVFAVPSLEALIQSDHEVVAVITATDKLLGRGKKKLVASAVKKCAIDHGIPVLQPPNLKHEGFIQNLKSFRADIQVVVAFRMLPVVVWDMPPYGTINLHGSLLPKYRGAAPINWAIINGEEYTGLTTFKLKHQIDTGNLIYQEKVPIDINDNMGSLHDKMKIVGAELVLKTINDIQKGVVEYQVQNDNDASHAPKIYTEDCEIDFNKSALEVHNFIRGLSPFPGAWYEKNKSITKIYRTQIINGVEAPIGELQVHEKKLIVGTGKGCLEVLEIKPAGKRMMSAKDYINGHMIKN